MAKKKNRHLNIAHKRAKRKRNQKSRRKQMALRKDLLLQSPKSDEEQLHDRIMKGGLLIEETEFENITFDPDLMRQNVLELLEFNPSLVEAGEHAEEENDHSGTIGEQFRSEVLPCLITTDFLRKILHALKACETRLMRIGYREKAEIAFVTRSLFELAEPDTLTLHPLVLQVCARTLEGLLTQSQFMSEAREAVQSVLSDVLTLSQAEEGVDGQNDIIEEETSGGLDQEESSDVAEESVSKAEPAGYLQTLSSEELPAKALYKNFGWLDTRQAIETGDGYKVSADTEGQVAFTHTTQQRHITLTADRLLLQCASKVQLEVAMKEIEQLCGQSLFYLARSVEE